MSTRLERPTTSSSRGAASSIVLSALSALTVTVLSWDVVRVPLGSVGLAMEDGVAWLRAVAEMPLQWLVVWIESLMQTGGCGTL